MIITYPWPNEEQMTDGETSEEEEDTALKNLCDDSSDDSLAEDDNDGGSRREELFISITSASVFLPIGHFVFCIRLRPLNFSTGPNPFFLN